MFIGLYARSELKKLKRNIFLAGAFLLAGGAFALVRELPQTDAKGFEWVYAAAVLVVTGIVCLAFAFNIIPLRKAYFSMNQLQLSYRLSFFGREYILPWSQLRTLNTTDQKVTFVLRDEKEIDLPLTLIPDTRIANHIKKSILLAAMERNLEVNGVVAHYQKVAV